MSCSTGPGLFSDFGRKAREILTKDYSDDQKLVISSQSETGLALGSTLVKKGGLSSGDVAAQYKLKNAVVDIKFDTESNISTTITVADILPYSKTIASWKLPDYNSGKVEVQYFHEHASLTTAVGLNKSPAFDVSATIGTPSVAFGTEASYLVTSGSFAKYKAGFSLKTPNVCASAILFDKGDAVRVSYLHHLDQPKRGTAVGEIARKFSTNENTLTVGCSYAIDPHTTMKAKLNNHGHLGVLVQHELKPKSILTVSGSFDTLAMEKTPRFGLALSLKP
ncbi:Porin/voltage-dependent anion-selective channel protein [Handroanthus impetiginosus]|uniref:Voltage-dependent anion-selective channel protein n=1 Tax=Handroanthus impetiginosus TaxID=429701 RepID=A0A2G9GCX2_9LAMI|nr:Porin/voltage-dependent anion-selective channel protein [Handroanthus impetiginosus]